MRHLTSRLQRKIQEKRKYIYYIFIFQKRKNRGSIFTPYISSLRLLSQRITAQARRRWLVNRDNLERSKFQEKMCQTVLRPTMLFTSHERFSELLQTRLWIIHHSCARARARARSATSPYRAIPSRKSPILILNKFHVSIDVSIMGTHTTSVNWPMAVVYDHEVIL